LEGITIPVHWRFGAEDVENLPGNFTVGHIPNGLPAPHKGDLIQFSGMPGVRFVVSYRELIYTRDPSRPVELHLHVSLYNPATS
jgi:hypothetical protein